MFKVLHSSIERVEPTISGVKHRFGLRRSRDSTTRRQRVQSLLIFSVQNSGLVELVGPSSRLSRNLYCLWRNSIL